VAPGNEEIDMLMLTGAQAVLLADPHWDQNNEGGEWHRYHFIHLIVEGLKRAKVKPLNYSQVTVVQQDLKDAIQKHTTEDPESQVREVLLKDKFLMKSAPDIHIKLQKSVAEGEKSLDQLIQLAMSIYYNRDLTKKREKDKKHHDLITGLRECPTQWGSTSQSCCHGGQEGHFCRECLKGGQPGRHPWPPPGSCPLCKGNHWRSKCLHLQVESGMPPPMD
jgi:hypothetical protein